jgi:hypothetical protein
MQDIVLPEYHISAPEELTSDKMQEVEPLPSQMQFTADFIKSILTFLYLPPKYFKHNSFQLDLRSSQQRL